MLTLLVVGEGVLIVATRHPPKRFETVDADSYMAFDTATGQLCKTFQTQSAPQNVRPSHTVAPPDQRRSQDPILDAIDRTSTESQNQDRGQLDFIQGLPECSHIH
jgi:hypothetical protein